MSVSLSFKWYDFWVGGFFDRFERWLYICPLPMVVVRIGRFGETRCRWGIKGHDQNYDPCDAGAFDDDFPEEEIHERTGDE